MKKGSHYNYHALVTESNDTSSEMLISEGTIFRTDRKRWSTASVWLTAMNTVFFIAGLACFLGGSQLPGNSLSPECKSRVSSFSPALHVIKYAPILFNFSSEQALTYQGYPTPDLDSAWDTITDNVRPTRISEEMLAQIGMTDDPTIVKYPPEEGGGVMASLGVLHQLHCLNLLRKSTYRQYYESDRFFQVRPEDLRGHLDHCIELLREVIACAGDVTVITYNWVPEKETPVPNFTKTHQCRQFDDILEWAVQNAVHIQASHMIKNSTTIRAL